MHAHYYITNLIFSFHILIYIWIETKNVKNIWHRNTELLFRFQYYIFPRALLVYFKLLENHFIFVTRAGENSSIWYEKILSLACYVLWLLMFCMILWKY